MPALDLDDKELSVDSSPNDALDETLDLKPKGDTEGKDAGSSDAHDDNADDSTSIVRDVVKESRGEASSADAAKEKTEAEGKEPKEEDNENYSDVPFNKHPRFQHLIRETKSLRGDAGQYRQVVGYMEQNGVSHQEFANVLQITALSKTDPVKAWEMAKPIVQELLRAAGEVLPPELQQRVAAGEFTPEAAAELARAQARVKSVETGRTFEQQRRERIERENAANALQDTASSWETDRQARDPNFAAKQPLLMREVAYLIQTEGRPDTPAGVRAQLDKAYKAVVLPAAKAPTKAPTVGQGPAKARPAASSSASGTNLQPVAQNTRDIIRGIIAKRAG